MSEIIDVSSIVTFHREGKYVARTLRSLSDAALFAAEKGIRSELVAVLDRSDEMTRDVLAESDFSAFHKVTRLEVDYGSVSLSRNAGCAASSGNWLSIIDGDDLLSYNTIHLSFEKARRLGPRVILVPKISMGFGEKYFTVEYFSQQEIAAFATVKYALYTSRVFFHRSLIDEIRYCDIPLERGYAYEDWHFNCNAMAAGYRFETVDNTVLLYRQRLASRNQVADRISSRLIPPSPLFQPLVFRHIFGDAMKCFAHGTGNTLAQMRGGSFLQEQQYLQVIARANAIDPAVDLGRYDWNCIGHFSNIFDPSVGIAYYRLCEAVGDDSFEEVFLLSSAPEASGVLDALSRTLKAQPRRPVLVLYDKVPDPEHFGDLPDPNAIVPVFLSAICADLQLEDRDLLCFKLLQAVAATAKLHVSPCRFGTRFLNRFSRVLADQYVIYHRPADRAVEWRPGYSLVDPLFFQTMSENFGSIDEVVCSDERTMRSDRNRLRFDRHKWRLRD
jgi:glycosyltransferase involved in cell wall biosynthesis